MAIILSFVCGVFVTLFTLLAMGMNEPVVTIPEWRRLPNHLETLAHWGATTTYYVRRKVPLPRRTPGASLTHVPNPPPPPHTTALYHPEWWERVATWKPIERLLSDLGRWIDGWDIVITDEELRYAWEDMWHDDPYRQRLSGRHRRDELRDDPKWRARWAGYETQDWPTLNTDGHGWNIVEQIRPAICTAPLRELPKLRSDEEELASVT